MTEKLNMVIIILLVFCSCTIKDNRENVGNSKKEVEENSSKANHSKFSYEELFDSISKQKLCNSLPDYSTPFKKLLNEEIALKNILKKDNNSNIRLVSFYYLRDIQSKHIYDACLAVENDTNTVSYVGRGWSISYNQPLFIVFVQALGSAEDMKVMELKKDEIENLIEKKNSWGLKK